MVAMVMAMLMVMFVATVTVTATVTVVVEPEAMSEISVTLGVDSNPYCPDPSSGMSRQPKNSAPT